MLTREMSTEENPTLVEKEHNIRKQLEKLEKKYREETNENKKIDIFLEKTELFDKYMEIIGDDNF